jgi:drug/metabolite transporter (DMT)-like permease
MKNFMLCLLNSALLVCGQMLFKFTSRGKEISSLSDVMKLLISPYMIAGIFLYGIATLLWVYILNKVPISYAYPIQSLAFPLVVMLAIPLFKEVVPVNRWIGITVILVGVIIASR